jgi:ABC-2 type transport system ATP-binding protein
MAETDDILIEAEDLGRRYAGCDAVSRVSFRVRRGELVALLGPNGSGKTTLLRMLAGSLSPTAGRARLCGLDVGEHPLEIRRRCGYLPEVTPLYSEMRVEEYLRYRGRLRGLRGTDLLVRLHEAMQHCGLAEVAKRPLIGSLSLGMRRRVALADCLLHSPDVMLLDAPLDGLDAIQSAALAGLLIDLSDSCAILFSTHGLEEIRSVCSRVLILNGGRLIADGTPEGLTQTQAGAQTFTQAFVRMTAATAEAPFWAGAAASRGRKVP